MFAIILPIKAQQHSTVSVGLLYGYSILTFNQQSDKFDKRIADEKISYIPMRNAGIEIGYSVWFTNRLSLQLTPRWQQWGGTINVQSNKNTSSMLNMEINYEGVRMPGYFQYMIWGNKNLQLNTALGGGIEYTYKLWFLPNNFYGSAPPQRRSVEILAPFVSAGFNLCYTSAPENRINYIIGIYYETDAIFNPNRFNEYNFRQNSVPLLSHQLFTTFKIQYRI